jgi:FlaG/FlaF family flagellin (archaellin)
MTKKKRSSHAVSEVLATVLLLGITIALFGFLNYIVFSFSFEPSAPSVNLIGSISADETYNNITIEHNGGESLERSTEIIITVGSHTNKSSVQDIINGATDWKLNPSKDDKNPNKWDFGETIEFNSQYDFTDTYIQVSVMDPSTNTLILSVILQHGPSISVLTNKPPTITTPLPTNGSIGNLLSLTWTIQINDPEGDPFTWTIQCCNGQTNNGIEPNGQKTLSLSGLSYGTPYKIWVNATDPTGSNHYTRRWYTFTTTANLPPTFSTPTPANGSTNQSLSLPWSIPMSDPEGDFFTWTIQCSNGQNNSGTGASNGTKTISLFGLSYATTYRIWVNATDPTGSSLYTRRWYSFTTKINLSPVFGTPSPANGSTGKIQSWNIPINDSEGNLFNWTIQCSNGQSSSGTWATNGTKTLSLLGLSNNKAYKVWVNATDPTGSGLYTRRWYTFTYKNN